MDAVAPTRQDAFLEPLQAFGAPCVFNPWADADPSDSDIVRAPAARLARLRAHLDCSPEYLLIGEAPGYQGCRFSGVPFASEALVLEGSMLIRLTPTNTRGRIGFVG